MRKQQITASCLVVAIATLANSQVILKLSETPELVESTSIISTGASTDTLTQQNDQFQVSVQEKSVADSVLANDDEVSDFSDFNSLDGDDTIQKLVGENKWTWNSWQVILLLANAFIGFLLFEWAWSQNKRFRDPIAELDDLMPGFRRQDATRWRKWHFYPGAVTLLIPRFVLVGVGGCIIVTILISLALICQPKNAPIRGCRAVIIRWIYKFFSWFFSFFLYFTVVTWTTLRPEDVNFYEEWLGPKETQLEEQRNKSAEADGPCNDVNLLELQTPSTYSRIPKRGAYMSSTAVCNHIGFIEILALIMSPLHPGFTPKSSIADLPGIGTLTKGLQSLFIDRGSDQASRDAIVASIIDRQRQIECEGAEFNKLCIFAEGTTSNGSTLLKFKRGAFEGMRTVTPCFVQIGDRSFNPSYDVLDFWVLLIHWLSSLNFYNLHLTIMPEFTPTEWMLDNHSFEGSQHWEVYAECVRQAIAHQGKFQLWSRSCKEKLAYEDVMTFVSDEMTVDGKTYNFPQFYKERQATKERSIPTKSVCEPLLTVGSD